MAYQTKPPAKNGFSQIFQHRVGRFSNRFFVLKPWDWDGRFEYNNRSKQSKNDVENFVHKPQILPQKPKIAEKLDLIGQNGYSFSYLWPLIEWNQVKYPKQHLLFFILFPSVVIHKCDYIICGCNSNWIICDCIFDYTYSPNRKWNFIFILKTENNQI